MAPEALHGEWFNCGANRFVSGELINPKPIGQQDMEFLPRDIVCECAIRGLSVRADALRNLQNFALEYPSGDALHALIDAIVARLEHCTIRVVDTAIAR